jgi:hypothetical protein
VASAESTGALIFNETRLKPIRALLFEPGGLHLIDQRGPPRTILLRSFAANLKHVGGPLGMTALLHTSGQTLSQHCLVPGAVLTAEGAWRTARGNYLFPKCALSRRFRGRIVSALRAAYP